MAATSATTVALPSSLLRRPSPAVAVPLAHPQPFILSGRRASAHAVAGPATRRAVACQVALDTDVSSSSSSEADEDSEAMAKVGRRVRVTVPLKVYHVMKAPELDLMGLEGVMKQYVGVWKGKKVSANLPFKVEFVLPENAERGPVKFVAHLKEDEFELLPED